MEYTYTYIYTYINMSQWLGSGRTPLRWKRVPLATRVPLTDSHSTACTLWVRDGVYGSLTPWKVTVGNRYSEMSGSERDLCGSRGGGTASGHRRIKTECGTLPGHEMPMLYFSIYIYARTSESLNLYGERTLWSPEMQRRSPSFTVTVLVTPDLASVNFTCTEKLGVNMSVHRALAGFQAVLRTHLRRENSH